MGRGRVRVRRKIRGRTVSPKKKVYNKPRNRKTMQIREDNPASR